MERDMAGQVAISQPKDSFEYMLLEGDPDHLRIVSTPNQISPSIDPSVLKLTHRIGRGPFGDVWIATHHQRTEDYDHYHEVAVKMLNPIKDDQIDDFLAKFDVIYSKCQGLENVCFLHGISIQNGRVCIAMKFYEGSIGDNMARLKGGRIPLPDVVRYGIDLAHGILELHSRGILVLNLKPCNVLLDAHGRAILGEIGIPSLLFGLSLISPDLVQRLGTPNYMAPEQWQPNIRGPVSYESDSWGFGCTIVELLSGIQPWRGKSPDEIYHLVVTKQEKPNIPSGLPPDLEDVLYGCFEYDFRRRPLIEHILHVFKSFQESVQSWSWTGNWIEGKSNHPNYTDWSQLKDQLQVGDTVRSRKPRNSYSMEVPEGTVVGMDGDGFVLVRVHGFPEPLRVRPWTVERVTYGFSAGDWVRLLEEDEKHSPVGILHSIERDGRVAVGFIGSEALWRGSYSELEKAESFCVGQFLRVKANVSSPRFEWLRDGGGDWSTGRISQVLPNGCLVVRFPGRFGEAGDCMADPWEVERVSFGTCEGVLNKYRHVEDFHWVVRPLVIAIGWLAVLKGGFFVRSRMKKKGDDAAGSNAWLPPKVANLLFMEGVSHAR